MAIVTISRGTFSGGKKLATCLAANLGYKLISREVVVEAAERYGVRQDELVRGMEQPPSFWDRFKIDRQIYIAAVTAALCRAVREDDVVYHGNAGHLLLSGIEHVLRVRVIAPQDYRLREATAAHGFDQREAEAYIRRKDQERVAWTRFLYGVEWRDPELYDLLLNLEKVSIEAACQAIVGLTERSEFKSTPKRQSAIDDLYLANHISVLLFRNPKVSAVAAKITVTVRDREVHLSGLLPGERFRADVLATVEEVPEVRSIHADMLGGRVEPV